MLVAVMAGITLEVLGWRRPPQVVGGSGAWTRTAGHWLVRERARRLDGGPQSEEGNRHDDTTELHKRQSPHARGNPEPDDVHVKQTKRSSRNKRYKFEGYIKTKDVEAPTR